MKKEIKLYVAIWILSVLIFNIIAFVFPDSLVSPTDIHFWMAYIIITVGFIGHLFATLFYFSKDIKRDYFLFFPIIQLGYTTLIAYFVIGFLMLILKFVPSWLMILLAICLVGFYVFSILKALTAAEVISEVEDRVEQATSVIRELTVQTKALIEGTEGELQEVVRTVYEELRYSDPVSSEATVELENQIRFTYAVFSSAVYDNDIEMANKQSEKMCCLVKSRNELCKLNKR